jgi:dienelactone hydrolase
MPKKDTKPEGGFEHRRTRPLLACMTAAAFAAPVFAAAQTPDATPVAAVHFATGSGQPNALNLLGYLRRPTGEGGFAAVVLLHGCGGDAQGLNRNWGARLQSWGYVVLTVDSFTPRGISVSCHSGTPGGRIWDPFGALKYLSTLEFVDSSRMALMGFSEGAWITLMDIEPRTVEGSSALNVRAAIAVYPVCSGSGVVSVPTLIVTGQLDDWTPADACRKMVAQQSDIGITRQPAPSASMQLMIIPGAYHALDNPKYQTRLRYMGHILEYNPAALNLATVGIRDFLRKQLSGP